jgi:hypothetical protein
MAAGAEACPKIAHLIVPAGDVAQRMALGTEFVRHVGTLDGVDIIPRV